MEAGPIQFFKRIQARATGFDFKLLLVHNQQHLQQELLDLGTKYDEIDLLAAGGDGFQLMVHETKEKLPPELHDKFVLTPAPAGNANDSYRDRFGRWWTRTLGQQLRFALHHLEKRKQQRHDIIRIKTAAGYFTPLSYIGIVFTPIGARNINQRQTESRQNREGEPRELFLPTLNQWWLETVALVQELWRIKRPVMVEINGVKQAINSLTSTFGTDDGQVS